MEAFYKENAHALAERTQRLANVLSEAYLVDEHWNWQSFALPDAEVRTVRLRVPKISSD